MSKVTEQMMRDIAKGVGIPMKNLIADPPYTRNYVRYGVVPGAK